MRDGSRDILSNLDPCELASSAAARVALQSSGTLLILVFLIFRASWQRYDWLGARQYGERVFACGDAGQKLIRQLGEVQMSPDGGPMRTEAPPSVLSHVSPQPIQSMSQTSISLTQNTHCAAMHVG